MKKFAARAKVVLSDAVTWLIFVALIVQQVAIQLPALGPIGEEAARIAVTVLNWIGCAVAIIRRVTPVVDKAERGILPKDLDV